MQLIDTHCHLDEEALYSDVENVVASAIENGVEAIITIGTNAESSRRSIELTQRFPGRVFATVGIHPNYAAEAGPGDWEVIEELAGRPNVVGLGETGLDRYWDYAPLDLQREYFHRHIELSHRTGKPFVVHCRDADAEVREVLREAASRYELNAVMHSFCQSLESAQEYVQLGLHLSFTGMLTFKRNAELRELAGQLPLDRLFVETDAPYLAPVPFRGKRNEPAYVRHVLDTLALASGVSSEEMASMTTANARRFFSIELQND